MEKQIVTKRLAWSIDKIAEEMGVSVPFLRKQIQSGDLKAKKFGARVLVLDRDLRAYLGEESKAHK